MSSAATGGSGQAEQGAEGAPGAAGKARRLLAAAAVQLQLARRRGREYWAEFRARSVYFQLKMLVVALYAASVVATVLLAAPESLASNQIGARIMVLEGDVVVGRYFVVHNESRNHWHDVVFEIDGGYTVRRELVRAGEKVTLYVKDFRRDEVRKRRGKEIVKRVAAPVDAPLSALTVRTSEGEASAEIASESPGDET